MPSNRNTMGNTEKRKTTNYTNSGKYGCVHNNIEAFSQQSSWVVYVYYRYDCGIPYIKLLTVNIIHYVNQFTNP